MSTVRIAAALGFLAVALGAFGAHGLKDLLARNGTDAYWHTAVLYHLAHAVVLFAVASNARSSQAGSSTTAFWLIFAGVVIFSGSLYALAITNVKMLGAVTPIGGVCLLLGWLWLAIAG